MKVPGKTFVGVFGFSLTMLSTILVVAVIAGAPFAVSAAAVDGFHAEMHDIEGENLTMSMVLGGIDECQALVLNEIDQAEVSGVELYRKIELPGGNVSLTITLPQSANMSMRDVEMKVMALNSEWLNTTDTLAYENYSGGMTMGRQEEFTIEARTVQITNATGRLYALSSGSMKLPLTMPSFDVGVNERDPEGFPMTTCPEKIENRTRNADGVATNGTAAS